MAYKLFYSPGSCSLAVHALLNELQQPVDLVKDEIGGGNASPELLKVNPRGAVPVLVTPETDTTKGQVIREGGAILVYLCDIHQSQLLPTHSSERATALEWLMTANATLHPIYGHFFAFKKMGLAAELMDMQCKRIQKLWDEIEQQLGKTGAYIAGDSMTVGDILLTVIANWNGWLTTPVTFGPNTQRLITTVSSRESFRSAMQAEGVEYKVAA